MKILFRILSFSKKSKGFFVGAIVFVLLNVALSLYAPILAGRAIDCIIGAGNVDFNSVFAIVIKLLEVIIFAALFGWLTTVCTNKIAYETVNSIRDKSFEKLQTVPLKYIDGRLYGEVINNIINDIEQISTGLLQGFTQLFTGVAAILGTLGFMLSINVKITIVVVVLTPLSILAAYYITGGTKKMFLKTAEVRGELSGLAEEMIGGIKTVKAFGCEDNTVEKFKELNEELNRAGFKSQFYSALVNPTTRFVNAIVYAAVTLVGGLTILKSPGALTVGLLSSFLSYSSQYTKPFNEISGVIAEFQSALASAKRVFELLDSPDEKADNKDAQQLLKSDGTVKFDNVCFSYSPEQKLLENISIDVKPGQKIAIVGPTGCGKTTLINLLMRFYDPVKGTIYLNGTDYFNITRSSLRKNFGMVLQETWVFKGTIRDNIAYGCENATDGEIIAAAKAAHAHRFIKKLPLGYNTVISDDGDGISQGEKQLISIARVMLIKPQILILDEATSNIDTVTEKYVQQAFSDMMKGRTSFVIAHRLSTITSSDLILVMKDGNIVEQGTHKELLSKQGEYYNLYSKSF